MTKPDKLAALRAAFGSSEEKQQSREFTNNYYPFWNMSVGQRVVVRFLPDANENNPRMFLEEKATHTLTINGQKRTVPCLTMYGDDCPVCKVSQDYYKANDKVNGLKYWRKKQYIAQVLIVEDPLPPNQETGETHQGQVRTISLGFQLYNIIKEAYSAVDEDALEDVPYDFKGGYDFVIKKTQQGEYASYNVGTKFQNKQRALTENELVAVEAGMVELHTLLPKNPGVEKIAAMLAADLNGESYSDKPSDSVAKPTASARSTASDDEDPPFDTTPKVANKPAPVKTESSKEDDSVDDMLAAIRARRKSKAEGQ